MGVALAKGRQGSLGGAGQGDDESSVDDLPCLPAHVREPARRTLSGGGACAVRIKAGVHSGGTWHMSAIGEPANGRTFQDLMPAIAGHFQPPTLPPFIQGEDEQHVRHQ